MFITCLLSLWSSCMMLVSIEYLCFQFHVYYCLDFLPLYYSLLLNLVELDNVLVHVLFSGRGCFQCLLGFASEKPP